MSISHLKMIMMKKKSMKRSLRSQFLPCLFFSLSHCINSTLYVRCAVSAWLGQFYCLDADVTDVPPWCRLDLGWCYSWCGLDLGLMLQMCCLMSPAALSNLSSLSQQKQTTSTLYTTSRLLWEAASSRLRDMEGKQERVKRQRELFRYLGLCTH